MKFKIFIFSAKIFNKESLLLNISSIDNKDNNTHKGEANTIVEILSICNSEL